MILTSLLPTGGPPTPPGEMLLEEFLRPLNMTQAELAIRTGLGARCVNEICRGKRSITARSAILLSDEFGNSVEFWLNLQRSFDLWMELKRMGRLREIPRATVRESVTRKVTSTVKANSVRKTKRTTEHKPRTRTAG